MTKETDVFAYMMANEKVVNMICVIEQNLEFFDEYEIKPDEEVKKVLQPILKRLESWVLIKK